MPGITPDFVWVKNGNSTTGIQTLVRFTAMTNSSAMGSNGITFTNGITGLVSGGFTVGDEPLVNENGQQIKRSFAVRGMAVFAFDAACLNFINY